MRILLSIPGEYESLWKKTAPDSIGSIGVTHLQRVRDIPRGWLISSGIPRLYQPRFLGEYHLVMTNSSPWKDPPF